MPSRSPKGWMFTLGLAALAVLGALAARAVSPTPEPDIATEQQGDWCVTYDPIYCCIRDNR